MARQRSFSALLAVILSGATATSAMAGAPKPKPKAKPAVAVKAPVISEEHQKALEELRGAYTFGMSKDDVIAVLAKQLDEAYADRLKGTTDIRKQDRLRAEKKRELQDIKDTYMEFDGTVTGWDVSLIDNEFGHKNEESVLEYWENEDGKSQRRFFFFDGGSLYKMALSLDVSDIPTEDRTFATFKGAMEGRYGAGLMDTASITWNLGDYRAVAKDKLLRDKALVLVMSDVKLAAAVEGRRVAKVKATDKIDSVTKAVIDRGGDAAPTLGEKSGATDTVIKATGSK